MPRITSQYYKSEQLKFRYEVSVNSSGIFTTTIPSDVAGQLIKVGIKLGANRIGNAGFFSAESLAELQGIIAEVCDKYSSRELIEEKIILRYSLNTTCSYCITKDGTIVPNGTYAVDIDGDYEWSGGTIETNATYPKPFGFNCYVKPIRVRIWEFLNGEIYKEEYRNSHDEWDGDSILRWLDGLCAMASDGKCKDIDYTPELGEFFKSVVMYIIKLNEKLKSVFGEDIEISIPALSNIRQLALLE